MPYKTHEHLHEPSPTQILWRYMNFAKFVDLIQQKNLFFPSLEQLHDDPWEGLPSKQNFDPDCPIYVRKACASQEETIDNKNPNNQRHIQTAKFFFGDQFDDYLKSKKQIALNLRGTFFINCWHMNDSESDSQWKIYGDPLHSLAIVTSFERLRDSIIDPLEIYGSLVTYYQPNQITPEGNAFWPVICKRWAFVHEREYRLIRWNPELIGAIDRPAGILIAVDLTKLIESIVVSPKAPSWFKNTIETFIKNAGLSIPVSKSPLLDQFV